MGETLGLPDPEDGTAGGVFLITVGEPVKSRFVGFELAPDVGPVVGLSLSKDGTGATSAGISDGLPCSPVGPPVTGATDGLELNPDGAEVLSDGVLVAMMLVGLPEFVYSVGVSVAIAVGILVIEMPVGMPVAGATVGPPVTNSLVGVRVVGVPEAGASKGVDVVGVFGTEVGLPLPVDPVGLPVPVDGTAGSVVVVEITVGVPVPVAPVGPATGPVAVFVGPKTGDPIVGESVMVVPEGFSMELVGRPLSAELGESVVVPIEVTMIVGMPVGVPDGERGFGNDGTGVSFPTAEEGDALGVPRFSPVGDRAFPLDGAGVFSTKVVGLLVGLATPSVALLVGPDVS